MVTPPSALSEYWVQFSLNDCTQPSHKKPFPH